MAVLKETLSPLQKVVLKLSTHKTRDKELIWVALSLTAECVNTRVTVIMP